MSDKCPIHVRYMSDKIYFPKKSCKLDIHDNDDILK